MKNFHLIMLTICATFLMLLMNSCNKENDEINLTIVTPGTGTTDSASTTGQSRTIKFNFSSPDIQSFTARKQTRASNPNYLLVMDVVDGKVSKVITRNTGDTSTDISGNATDTLNLTLDYGEHTLYFLCCSNMFASYTATDNSKTVTWNASTAALGDTWTYKLNLTVNGSTTAQSFTLNRAVATISVKSTDAIPTGISTMNFTISGGSWTYDFSTMSGGAATTVNRTIDISSYVGRTNLNIMVYTFRPNDAVLIANEQNLYNVGTFTAKALFTDGTSVEHSMTDTPICINHKTIYSGLFYSKNSGLSLAVETDWSSDIQRTLAN